MTVPLTQILREASEVIEGFIDRQEIPVACAPGCNSCCKQPVTTSIAEAEVMLDAYREQYGDAAVKKLVRNVRRSYDKLATVVSPSQYMQTRTQCPFLQHGQCSVYDARPLACRTMVHTDRSKCEEDLQRGRRGEDGLVDAEWSRIISSTTQVGIRAKMEMPRLLESDLLLNAPPVSFVHPTQLSPPVRIPLDAVSVHACGPDCAVLFSPRMMAVVSFSTCSGSVATV